MQHSCIMQLASVMRAVGIRVGNYMQLLTAARDAWHAHTASAARAVVGHSLGRLFAKIL